MASFQAYISQISFPIWPNCVNGEKTAEYVLVSCPKWDAEHRRHFPEFMDITYVIWD